MRKIEIEAWALDVIEQVKKGQPHEDARVELKSQWPDKPQESARQIAGLANAARGEAVLWLVGVHQKRGVEGVAHLELAKWFEQVKAEFDGVAPALTDLNITVDGKCVVAMYFETDRAPFVVRNPCFNKQGGGPVRFEVPWREGTSTRSATRSDLIKLLVPVQRMPRFEVLNARLQAGVSQGLDWTLYVEFYITPRNDSRVVIPFHSCEVALCVINGEANIRFEHFRFEPSEGLGVGARGFPIIPSKTIIPSASEVIIDGPGVMNMKAYGTSERSSVFLSERLRAIVKLSPIDVLVSHTESIEFAFAAGTRGRQREKKNLSLPIKEFEADDEFAWNCCNEKTG